MAGDAGHESLVDIISFAQSILMAAATILVWLWGKGRVSGEEHARMKAKLEDLEEKVNGLEDRIDNGSAQYSILTGRVQTIAERIAHMEGRLPDRRNGR